MNEACEAPDQPDLLRQPDFRVALGLAKAVSVACGRSELSRGAMLAGIALAAQRELLSQPLSSGVPPVSALFEAAAAEGLQPTYEQIHALEDGHTLPLDAGLRSALSAARRGSLDLLIHALLAAARTSTTAARGCSLSRDDRFHRLVGVARRIAPDGADTPLSAGVLALSALELHRRGTEGFDASLRTHLTAHTDDIEALARQRGWQLPDVLEAAAGNAAHRNPERESFDLTQTLLPFPGSEKLEDSGDPFRALVDAGIREAVTWRLRERVATHEAGHAAVSLLLRPQVRIESVTVLPHGNSLGRTIYREDNPAFDLPLTRADLMTRLCVSLAGRAAQRRRYGEQGVDVGSETDLEQATEQAWRCISRCGFDDQIGPLSLRAIARGGGAGSSWLHELAQRRLQALMAEADLKVARLVDAHWPRIERLADALAERETLSECDVIDVVLPNDQPFQLENTP